MDKYKHRLYLSLLDEVPSMQRSKVCNTRINQIKSLSESLHEYEMKYDIQLSVENSSLNDLIGFGHHLKDQRNLNNSSVVTYLTVLLAHLRERGTSLLRKKITKEFPFAQDTIPNLPEDIVQAILETQVDDKHRHVLDAIKLILLHGFRYSDLWVLKKGECVFETEKGTKYFKYYPPKNRSSIKNRKKGVVVALHPIGEQIINYWSDRATCSTWNENRAPKGFMDKTLYPHIEYQPPRSIGGYYLFQRPIIQIPHHFFDKSVKRYIFTEVHKQWCIREHYRFQGLNKHKLGLMAIVPGTDKMLWETLTYHSFRHIYCSRYLINGGNILDLRDNVGHSSIAVTQKYAHTIEADRIERSVEIMNY